MAAVEQAWRAQNDEGEEEEVWHVDTASKGGNSIIS